MQRRISQAVQGFVEQQVGLWSIRHRDWERKLQHDHEAVREWRMHECMGNVKTFESKSSLSSKSKDKMQSLNAWCRARDPQLSCTNSFIQVFCHNPNTNPCLTFVCWNPSTRYDTHEWVFLNASTSACPMTFPAPHFSKFPISSFIPSKPRSTSNCMSELSSITSSGFHKSTSDPPSFTFTHVWSLPCANLIEFSSASNNSGAVARAFSGPCSKLHATGPKAWHASSMTKRSKVIGTGVPSARSAAISSSRSCTDCSASLFTPEPSVSMDGPTWSEPAPTGAGLVSVSTSISWTSSLGLATLGTTTGVALGVSLASNAARFLLHSALCLIPGTSIPESHAGHLGVFGNTRTSCLTTSGNGDGDFGETFGEAFGSAGPSSGRCTNWFLSGNL